MRVVLVAADRELRESIAAILETRGHDVLRFAEADRALHQLEADQATSALIVAEDAVAGMELCWEARLLASFERPIYICLVSPPMGSEIMVEALDCGADDVLQLPLLANELYARLRSAERLTQMQLKLVQMATRDGLTGLLNRPAFFRKATKMCRDAETPLGAVMVDIDHFKDVNDRYGHAAGDNALRAVAQCLMDRAALAGRLGGEEFALLLPDSSLNQAWRVAEDLRRHIALQEIKLGATSLRLSCSFGVAIGAPGENIDEILRRADAALYAAKRAGRNRVALHDPAAPSLPRRTRSAPRVRDENERERRQAAG